MSNTERRQPTLADRFVSKRYAAHDRYIHRDVLDHLQRRTRAAHKFVLDDKATERIGNVVRDIPDLLIREYDFARAPFDLTWVEFKHPVFWRACGNSPDDEDPIDGDLMVGYLLDGNIASIVTGGTVGSPLAGAFPSILHFALNTQWDELTHSGYNDSSHVAEVVNGGGDLGLDRFLWGSTLKHMDQATRDRLRERNTVSIYRAPPGVWSEEERFAELLKHTIQGSIGELRNIIAIMLMLNRPSLTRYSNVQPGKGFSKGKLIPYMAHTTVTIDMDAVPTMRLLGTPEGEGVPRRRHEVRGHYCQNREARDYLRIAGCIHDWQTCHDDWEVWLNAPIGMPGEPGVPRNWVCNTCGGKRWWKHEHERGDASLGFVTHDYQVTAR